MSILSNYISHLIFNILAMMMQNGILMACMLPDHQKTAKFTVLRPINNPKVL